MPRRPGGGSSWPQVPHRRHVKKNTGDTRIHPLGKVAPRMFFELARPNVQIGIGGGGPSFF